MFPQQRMLEWLLPWWAVLPIELVRFFVFEMRDQWWLQLLLVGLLPPLKLQVLQRRIVKQDV